MHVTKRGWVLGAVVALVIAGGVVLIAVDLTRDDDPTTPSRPEIQGTGGFLESPEEESWGEVHFTFESERDEASFLNVYFLADGSDRKILKAAKECVEEFLPDHQGVSCYGFDTEEALEVADPDPATGGMEKRCWRAYYSDSDAVDQGTGQTTGRQYQAEGCP